jgi:cysteine desulfurases, SufS subfamily
MSTAELNESGGLRRLTAAPAGTPGTADPAGFPFSADALASSATAALIARLGSAMLTRLPAETTAAPHSADALPSSVDSAATPDAVAAVPALLKSPPPATPLGEAALRSLLAPRLAGSAASRPEAGTATGPGVPYFIQDASGQAATSVPPAVASAPPPGADARAASPTPTALSPVPLPGEAELRSLLAPVLTASSPALPGMPALASAADPKGQGFYFLNQVTSGSRSDPSREQAAAAGTVSPAGAHPPFDVNAVRRDFPILQEQINGRPLIWLDNGATTQKPQFVIDRLVHFYQHENSNIHRAAHTLAARATDAYEEAREKVRRFMNASSVDEIVFARGTTEAINLVAQTWGRQNIGADDEILITWLEHHANIVPWQMLAQETGARLKVAPVDDRGQVLLDQFERLLNPRTRLVAFAQVSNALGTITPAARLIEMAKRYDAKVLVDGAQSVSHLRTDVQRLDCDFFAFSGHKIFAPTGIGVLYGKRDVLEGMLPWQGGGNMIKDVTFEKTEYQAPPQRFEAGTGNIADAVGLGAALDYVERIGLENIAAYEHSLLTYATHRLQSVPGLTLIGTAAEKAAVLSFVLDGVRSEDVGTALNQEGIAVRAGHHCAQPILRRFGLESTVRPSLAFYNTTADIDALTAALKRLASRSPNLD